MISGSISSSLEVRSGNSNRILLSGSIGDDITVDLKKFEIKDYMTVMLVTLN